MVAALCGWDFEDGTPVNRHNNLTMQLRSLRYCELREVRSTSAFVTTSDQAAYWLCVFAMLRPRCRVQRVSGQILYDEMYCKQIFKEVKTPANADYSLRSRQPWLMTVTMSMTCMTVSYSSSSPSSRLFLFSSSMNFFFCMSVSFQFTYLFKFVFERNFIFTSFLGDVFRLHLRAFFIYSH